MKFFNVLKKHTFQQWVIILFTTLPLSSPNAFAAEARSSPPPVAEGARFPHYKSNPISYLRVKLQDNFWAPRQKVIRDVTLPWATRHLDEAGGLQAYKAHPDLYKAKVREGDWEAIKFIEALVTADGLERDPAIEGLIDAWTKQMISTQLSDGFFAFGDPISTDPIKRWLARNVYGRSQDYGLARYLDGAISYREVTGKDAAYHSAVRAMDDMVSAVLDGRRTFISKDSETPQALLRLYGITGNTRYLQLAEWLIGQRGHHEQRESWGLKYQDEGPVADQRTIEGHAVRAANLWDSVTGYVAATGNADYRKAVLSVWDNFVEHKMFIHGGGGNRSSGFEGYVKEPDFLPPSDSYSESCSVAANFQWANNLFRLTGEARYLDTAELMLYNAFPASLSLSGDRYFYCNVLEKLEPTLRSEWHFCPCCPPNIARLFSTLGGHFYSTDKEGIFVKFYGASEADIPFRDGVKLIQRGDYPWRGDLALQVEPATPSEFSVRLRIPQWAGSCEIKVNGVKVETDVRQGWVSLNRRWERGDKIELSLPMTVKRVTMPPRFKWYDDLVALQRGPIVYCVEEQDSAVPLTLLYLPEDTPLTEEFQPGLLGGVTVIKGTLPSAAMNAPKNYSRQVPVRFIPYGVWNNRGADAMRVWLPSKLGAVSGWAAVVLE
jgi:DUF1680 family protein